MANWLGRGVGDRQTPLPKSEPSLKGFPFRVGFDGGGMMEVRVDGYGGMKGDSLVVRCIRKGKGSSVRLVFHEDGEDFLVPFSLRTGKPEGNPTDGYRIAKEDLQRLLGNDTLKQEAGLMKRSSVVEKTAAPKVRTAAKVAKPEAANGNGKHASEEESEPVTGLSPMERGMKPRASKLPEGSTEVAMTHIMAKQILWDEYRPYPNGRPTKGFKDLRNAIENGYDRNYLYIVLNDVAAGFLVNSVFVNGFKKNWKGNMVSGFKKAAKRIAEELEASLGIPVPEVIASYGGERLSRAAVAAKPKGKPGRKPKAAAEPTPEPVSRTAKAAPKANPAAAEPVKRGPGRPKKAEAPVAAAKKPTPKVRKKAA